MVDLNMRVVEPRKLSLESRFRFRCHPGVPCFTECCGKTTIILTPYDILRLKNRLNMKAADFLDKYTRMEPHDKSGLPMVIMDMPRFEHRCPFVRPVSGCTVYRDRPASCRYYPIGQGTLITEEGLDEFYFYVREEHCQGFEEEAQWTVASWRKDQGVDKYDEMNREWKVMMLRRGGRWRSGHRCARQPALRHGHVRSGPVPELRLQEPLPAHLPRGRRGPGEALGRR
jgi:Fe-S-cluster containining protein